MMQVPLNLFLKIVSYLEVDQIYDKTFRLSKRIRDLVGNADSNKPIDEGRTAHIIFDLDGDHKNINVIEFYISIS